LACYLIGDSGDYEIVALLATITEAYDRVSMHGVRRILIERQAESLGLPLETVFILAETTNQEYEQRMGNVLSGYKEHNVNAVAFGDVFPFRGYIISFCNWIFLTRCVYYNYTWEQPVSYNLLSNSSRKRVTSINNLGRGLARLFAKMLPNFEFPVC